MKIRTKTIILTSGGILSYAIVVLLTAYILMHTAFESRMDETKKHLMMTKETYLKDITTVAETAILRSYNAYKNSGSQNIEFYQNQAKKEIDAMRYANDGYFFVYGYDGVNIVLPVKKELEGQSLLHLKDKQNIYFVKDLINNAKEKNGKFVEYLWYKKSIDKDVPKLSYSVGIPEWNWMLGTGVYIDDVQAEIDLLRKTAEKENRKFITFIFAISAILLGITGILSSVFSFKITKPLENVTEYIREIAQGEADLTKRLDTNSDDEIGDLSNWFNEFITKLQEIISQVKDVNNDVNTTAKKFVEQAQDLSTGAEEMSVQIKTISSATEEISITTSTISDESKATEKLADNSKESVSDLSESLYKIAASTGEAKDRAEEITSQIGNLDQNLNLVSSQTNSLTMKVNTISAAIEEMSSTLNEISSNSSETNRISTEAKEQVEITNVKMDLLKSKSNEITKIIATINDIADQTNMLALNATIEAASAGDAGKGFAVVANEVKELAKQTQEATQSIRTQIESIQSASIEASEMMNKFKEIIETLYLMNANIATAIEEQSVTTSEISTSTTDIASFTNSVNEYILNALSILDTTVESNNKVMDNIVNVNRDTQTSAQTSKVVSNSTDQTNTSVKEITRGTEQINIGINEISFNLTGVLTAAEISAKSAELINQDALNLEAKADKMQKLVERFKV